MLTVFIIYSNDRLTQLQQTIACLSDLELYDCCQKILCVDGQTNIKPTDFDIVEVKRPNDLFCWAAMWEAGVQAAAYDNILYLDSDRILPKTYFVDLLRVLHDNVFVFPDKMYKFKHPVDTKTILTCRENLPADKFLEPDHPVYDDPIKAVRKKNPMSGCTAFTKNGFRRSGGLDPTFVGWGYPDTDYFIKTFRAGFEFTPLPCYQLHLCHDYNDGGKRKLNRRGMRLMSTWNGYKFCKKWQLPLPQEIINSFKDLQIEIEEANRHSLESFVAKYNKDMTLL